MNKINKKIMDYIVIGSMGITMLGGVGYFAYDIIKNKTLTEKGFTAGCVGLGATALGTFYWGAKAIGEALEEARPEEEDENSRGKLEKDVKK